MIILEKTWIDKLLKISLGLIIAFAIFSQIYSLIQIKAFWLDEWFVLYNIKYRNFSELFDFLWYFQQFPRIYLVIVKTLAELSDYNYFALRLLPTSMQIINIILIVFLIRKIVFPDNEHKGFLFVLFFLSFQPTFFYFTQLKQYTMDMFFSLLSVYCFYHLARYYDRISVRSSAYLFILSGIFAGPFFSYTFPIVIIPLMLLLSITVIYDFINKKTQIKPILLILVFLASLIINYFTDLQFLLSNKGLYRSFDEYVMDYNSVSSITNSLYNVVRLFAYNFIYTPQNYHFLIAIFLHLTRITIIFLTFIGLILIITEQFTKIRAYKLNYFESLTFPKKPNISVFLLILFFVTLLLFFLKMLPMGHPRLNYFSYLFTTYFLITGMSWLTKKYKKIKILIIAIVIFSTLFQITRSYIREIENKNLIFDQKIYENIGNAIIKAQNDRLPIVVVKNEFYPMSIMENQENLIIKSHHLFKPNRPVNLYIVSDFNKETIHSLQLRRYIKLNKYDFNIQNDN